MSFICGDCKKEHPVPTVQEDLDGTPCFDALLRDRDRLNLQNHEWEKMVRGIADQLYATGKELRTEMDGVEAGKRYQAIATEMHRRCQIIKGEEPLPAVGERLTEKRNHEH